MTEVEPSRHIKRFQFKIILGTMSTKNAWTFSLIRKNHWLWTFSLIRKNHWLWTFSLIRKNHWLWTFSLIRKNHWLYSTCPKEARLHIFRVEPVFLSFYGWFSFLFRSVVIGYVCSFCIATKFKTFNWER